MRELLGHDFSLAIVHASMTVRIWREAELLYLTVIRQRDVADDILSSSQDLCWLIGFMVAPVPDSLDHLTRGWVGIKSIGQAITVTTHPDGRETSEVRLFISSRAPKVKEFAQSVRSHWSIESMHWIVDVVFDEDASQLKNGHSPQNYSFLRKFVISLLKRDTSKGSLKNKRKKAAWSVEFLENILFGASV